MIRESGLSGKIEILGWEFTAIAFGETRRIAHPCVYLMAQADAAAPGVHRIHYAGQTHNLGERFSGHHRLEAALASGATHVLALVVENEVDRLALETLLRYHFRPPINQEPAPDHIEGWRAARHCNRPLLAAKAREAHLKGSRRMLPPMPWNAVAPLTRKRG